MNTSAAKTRMYSARKTFDRSKPKGNNPKLLSSPTVTAILIDSQSLFREGLTKILSETNYRIAATAASLADIQLPALQTDQVELVVVGSSDSAAATAAEINAAKERFPNAKRVVINRGLDLRQLVSVSQVGVDTCFVRAATTETLIKSLDLIMLGELVFSPASLPLTRQGADVAAPIEVEPMPVPKQPPLQPTHRLSTREVEILHCLMRGDSNKLIARRIDIADATVKVHIKAILRKIRVLNRTQAAIWAMNNGFPEPVAIDAPPKLNGEYAAAHPA